MTVIAWDGKTLATDKQMTNGMTKLRVTKIFRHDDVLLAICGNASAGMETIRWFQDGAAPNAYPAGNRTGDEGASLIVIDKTGLVLKYEKSPYPFEVEGKFCAFGCGDESAMIAMECGCSARQAVELVCKYNTGCGLGVDVLEI